MVRRERLGVVTRRALSLGSHPRAGTSIKRLIDDRSARSVDQTAEGFIDRSSAGPTSPRVTLAEQHMIESTGRFGDSLSFVTARTPCWAAVRESGSDSREWCPSRSLPDRATW